MTSNHFGVVSLCQHASQLSFGILDLKKSLSELGRNGCQVERTWSERKEKLVTKNDGIINIWGQELKN